MKTKITTNKTEMRPYSMCIYRIKSGLPLTVEEYEMVNDRLDKILKNNKIIAL